MGATLTHTDETSSDDSTTVTDGTASFSVTATNYGPQTANGVVVEVNLPVGLNAPKTLPAGVTHACGVISWRVGDLTASGATPASGGPPSSKTLTFTAEVSTGGPKSLTVEAEVHSSTVDEIEANDTDSVVVVTDSTVVTPPFFGGAMRSVPENAIAGTHAGTPVVANNPDGRTIYYSLSGRCSDRFNVDKHGQIRVTGSYNFNYDEQSHFDLTLHVSDGLDDMGNTEPEDERTIDDSEPVTINVIETEFNAVHPWVTFEWNPVDGDAPLGAGGNPITSEIISLNAQINGLPKDSGTVEYAWEDQNGNYNHAWSTSGSTFTTSFSPGEVEYRVHVRWNGGGISATQTIHWVNE